MTLSGQLRDDNQFLKPDDCQCLEDKASDDSDDSQHLEDDDSQLEFKQSQALLAELHEELATMKANQSQ